MAVVVRCPEGRAGVVLLSVLCYIAVCLCLYCCLSVLVLVSISPNISVTVWFISLCDCLSLSFSLSAVRVISGGAGAAGKAGNVSLKVQLVLPPSAGDGMHYSDGSSAIYR